ncbi:hypothetical protein PHJA_002007200 [Phtheirospermum japonicum]|uniref:Uncharacterized protein n=1 Tax=Phtheirospermum japonicum TaxID=374723 RepID=A0A830CRY5_9LAMI|nr:hypothetical protein PHJA_002007200 [Phtheirospermum japonicum]
MAESEMCTESMITAEKRRISLDTSPTELPSTKRRQTSVSGISDPSRITQLVDDPTIMGLAHKLAGDLGFVQMAKELLLSLQGVGAEHLPSLRIWHNQPLLNALKQYQLMPAIEETFPHENQQIEERMARIMEQPSLKSLLGEKEDGAIMRAAIIILLAYWIDGDNENETLEDVPSIDDHWIDGDNENETLEDVPSIDDQDGSEDMGSCINLDESIIYDLVDHTRIEEIACEVESGSGLAIILDELLKSVLQPRASLHEDCKANFKIVNMAWEDNQLISLLLKQERVIHQIERYFNVSNQQLRETLTPLIKDHLSMRDIFTRE